MLPREINEAHNQSDADSSPFALHHTLGKGHNQAAPGDHNHDANYSALSHNHDASYSVLGHTHTPVAGKMTGANGQTTAAAVYLKMQFETNEIDQGVNIDLTNERIVIEEAGIYLIIGRVPWASGTGARVRSVIYKNGVAEAEESRYYAGGTSPSSQQISTILDLAVNDYIELFAYSSAAVSITPVSPFLKELMVAKL